MVHLHVTKEVRCVSTTGSNGSEGSELKTNIQLNPLQLPHTHTKPHKNLVLNTSQANLPVSSVFFIVLACSAQGCDLKCQNSPRKIKQLLVYF